MPLDLLWEFVIPGETTEEYFLSLAGKPLRKIDEKEKTIYLYQGKGIIPDSVTVREGKVVLLDFTSTSRLFLVEVARLLGESPGQREKSSLNKMATIYDFPNNGIAVTVNDKEEVLRITRHEAGKSFEINKAVSAQTVETVFYPRQWWNVEIQNKILLSGAVILTTILILLVVKWKKAHIHKSA